MFFLYCSNNSDIISESIENCSPLTFMKCGYLHEFIIIKAKYLIAMYLYNSKLIIQHRIDITPNEMTVKVLQVQNVGIVI